MKNLFFIALLIAAFPILGFAVNNEKIYISIYQPEKGEITTEASKILENKMRQLIASDGIVDEDPNNRFVLTAKVSVTSKDIAPSTPPRISEKIDFTFMVGDVVENKVFETCTISAIGIGINENKAFISAINKVNINNTDIKSFLERAKQKIVQYYSVKCEQIIMQAKQKAADRKFDDAIYELIQIPEVCDCAKECQELQIDYYSLRTELNAAQLFNEAKAIWASSPTAEGASSAADIISHIPAGTKVQVEIEKLTNEIEAKLKADQRKEWAFKIQQYRDGIEREKREYSLRSQQQKADNEYRAKQQVADNTYRARQHEANNAARRQTIEACRQVGLEYARNQPKTVVYRQNIILW